MVNVDKAVIARLKKSGKTFEILVDCDQALAFQQGQEIALRDILATEEIYEDVKKADLATKEDLQSVFKTENVDTIATAILKHGEVQLTAEHRKQLMDQKRKQLVALIARNAVDPKTGIPHPPQRIENAMNDAKVHLTEHLSAEEQMQDVIKQLRPILPISFEKRELEITIPAKHAGRCMRSLHQLGKIKKESWLNDGSLMVIIELPAGQQETLENELNNVTHGDMDFKILRSI